MSKYSFLTCVIYTISKSVILINLKQYFSNFKPISSSQNLWDSAKINTTSFIISVLTKTSRICIQTFPYQFSMQFLSQY